MHRTKTLRIICGLIAWLLCFSLCACERSKAPLTPGLSMIEGVPNHDKNVAMKTDHFTITAGMMGYFFYTCGVGVLEEIKQTHTFDEDVPLHAQMYDDTRSYYDMIMNEALERLSKLLICCEAALAEGVTLEAEEQTRIEDRITAERTRVAMEYRLEYDTYLKQNYGSRITSEDIRGILEMETLASRFSRVISDRLEEGITKEEVEAYLAEQDAADDTPSRSITFLYIPFIGDTANAESTEKVCEAMQKSPTAETLKGLTEYGTLGEEKNLTPENSGISAITSWLFDSSRRIGDWGRVEVEGATYVLLYTENGISYGEVLARMELYDTAYATWYNGWVETLEFAYNYDCLDSYDMSE